MELGQLLTETGLKKQLLILSRVKISKAKREVFYSYLSSPDKIFTFFIRIAFKFHFLFVCFFLRKHMDFFFPITCTYKAIIHEDSAVCFAFPNLAQPNLFPRGLHVFCCFPVCLGITASPFGTNFHIVLSPLSEQCRPICICFTTALLCLAQPPDVLPIHLLLKNEGVMLLHSGFENPDLL